MWILRWTFIALIILIILGFALQNTQMVEVTIWTWNWEDIPLYFVVYFAFAAGMLSFLLVAVVKHIQYLSEIRSYKREIKQLRGELERLRTISLTEGLDDDITGDASQAKP